MISFAFTTIVDRQFKEDRTLCPVQALRYQRPEKMLIPSLYFLQERLYIRPTTLSSWLKQTKLLYCKEADQQFLDLVQVKAHDIRDFVESKAFYRGRRSFGGSNHANSSLHDTFTSIS